MKITDLKYYVYAPIKSLPWFFVEVETDEGVPQATVTDLARG